MRKRVIELSLGATLMLSLVVNVLLTKELKAARTIISGLTHLMPGDAAPEVKARLAGGGPTSLKWGDSKLTILYYFDPGCSWCKRNAAAFSGLVQQVRGRARVVSYTPTLKGLEQFKLSTHHEADIITDDRQDIRSILKLGGTPQTLLVDSKGHVVKNWSGAYVELNKRDIETYFGITIPDLLPAPHL
jgi:peroxiredoxin